MNSDKVFDEYNGGKDLVWGMEGVWSEPGELWGSYLTFDHESVEFEKMWGTVSTLLPCWGYLWPLSIIIFS